MKTPMLIIACVLVAFGCATATVGYTACFGFCMKIDVDKDATPTHVSETVKETIKTVTD